MPPLDASTVHEERFVCHKLSSIRYIPVLFEAWRCSYCTHNPRFVCGVRGVAGIALAPPAKVQKIRSKITRERMDDRHHSGRFSFSPQWRGLCFRGKGLVNRTSHLPGACRPIHNPNTYLVRVCAHIGTCRQTLQPPLGNHEWLDNVRVSPVKKSNSLPQHTPQGRHKVWAPPK